MVHQLEWEIAPMSLLDAIDPSTHQTTSQYLNAVIIWRKEMLYLTLSKYVIYSYIVKDHLDSNEEGRKCFI